MAQQTHYFLAVPLPGHIKELVKRWQELMQPRLAFKSWVHPEDLHITLFFLGNASFSQVNMVKKEVTEAVKQHSAFHLELNGVGTFGEPESPRIFWGGVNHSEHLTTLQSDISLACERSGFKRETRPYNPHITMARKWVADESFSIEQAENIVFPKAEFCEFKVDQVVLYQTHLDRLPKYQPLSVFPFS